MRAHRNADDPDELVIHLSRAETEAFKEGLKWVLELVGLRQWLDDQFASSDDPKATAARPQVAFTSAWLASVANTLIYGDRVDLEASAHQAWAHYCDVHGLTYAELETTPYESLGTQEHYRRPRKTWPYVSNLLLQGLLAAELGGEPPPTLERMCDLFVQTRVHGAPRNAATLSRWVNEARHDEGLPGGYKAAIQELLPAARRQVHIDRARQVRTG